MNVTQGTISKIESFDLRARLEFFITYANVLGYQLILTDMSEEYDEPSRFRERQSRISKELSGTNPSQWETLPPQRTEMMPESIAFEHKKRIIKSLLEARRNIEEEVYRRGIVQSGNIPDIGLFDLLPDDLRDRYAADRIARRFYIRHCMALYEWIENPSNA